jgi:ABC-type cobalamin transport system permease subunit
MENKQKKNRELILRWFFDFLRSLINLLLFSTFQSLLVGDLHILPRVFFSLGSARQIKWNGFTSFKALVLNLKRKHSDYFIVPANLNY